MINWNKVNRMECDIIRRICKRAVKLFPDINYMDLEMDVTAAHIKEPLDLAKFESFGELDFFHDIFGIRRHINRATGDLMDCFLPRCSS